MRPEMCIVLLLTRYTKRKNGRGLSLADVGVIPCIVRNVIRRELSVLVGPLERSKKRARLDL